MAPIRVLTDEVANQIAAGEVVERPASVVKELVENALDAGARHIAVEVVAGGKKRISVVDDGSAMSRDDVLLAIEPHATSKISSAADLDNIETFGFRGEALPSIAAVSKFEVVSRREHDLEGTRVNILGNKLRDVKSVGAPRGTRITVADLFYNTPGRRKFLKTTNTELSHVIKVVQGLALAHPYLGFRLKHNGRRLLDVPPCTSLADRVATVFGTDMVTELVDVDIDENGYGVHGLAGTPAITRSDRSGQYFFVNSRPIVSPLLTRAVARAYHGLLTVGRHPVCVLKLDVPHQSVDVNVHPAKREVRFRDESIVQGQVQKSVREALSKGPSRRSVIERQPVKSKAKPDTEKKKTDTRREMAVKVAHPPRQPAPPPPRRAEKDDVQVDTSPPEPVQETPSVEDVPPAAPLLSEEESPQAVFVEVDRIDGMPFQIFNTYLVIPQADRLLLVDQHALHERIVFDELHGMLSERKPTLQRLLVPIPVEVPPNQAAQLADRTEFLHRLGIELENFGDNTFLVTGACHMFSEQKIDDLVRRVASELCQGDLFRDEEQLWESMLVMSVSACRTAIKAGQQLSVDERRALLNGLKKLTPPYTCPHGRPIVTELMRDQIERSFRRT